MRALVGCEATDVRGTTDGLTVVQHESLDQLPAAYHELFARAGATSIFLDLEWFRTLAGTALNRGERVVVYGVESRAEGPLGIFVMRRGQHGTRPWSVRRIDGLANF